MISHKQCLQALFSYKRRIQVFGHRRTYNSTASLVCFLHGIFSGKLQLGHIQYSNYGYQVVVWKGRAAFYLGTLPGMSMSSISDYVRSRAQSRVSSASDLDMFGLGAIVQYFRTNKRRSFLFPNSAKISRYRILSFLHHCHTVSRCEFN